MKLIQWRVVCAFTSNSNEKCETILHEGWCVTLHRTTMRSVRLYSKKGGVCLYITQQWEVWDYTPWRMVCDFTSHNNEKCETIFNEGWCVCAFTSHNNEKCETIFNEGWCVRFYYITMRSVRLYSMKVVYEIILHNNEKCANICNEGWCVSLHYMTMRYVRIYAMKGRVWVYIT